MWVNNACGALELDAAAHGYPKTATTGVPPPLAEPGDGVIPEDVFYGPICQSYNQCVLARSGVANVVGKCYRDLAMRPGTDDGESASDEPKEPPSDRGSDSLPATYTVQPGDTLVTIAQDLYGDPSKFERLAAANDLGPATPLRVGQVLQVPPDR